MRTDTLRLHASLLCFRKMCCHVNQVLLYFLIPRTFETNGINYITKYFIFLSFIRNLRFDIKTFFHQILQVNASVPMISYGANSDFKLRDYRQRTTVDPMFPVPEIEILSCANTTEYGRRQVRTFGNVLLIFARMILLIFD